ncbi:MAG: DUF3810 domain-containing protein [Weeksellaceae bacterium]|nr:DUF3810 domain-containing protein [Weeksellaceae bacterium]
MGIFERFFEVRKEFHQSLFQDLSFSAGDVLYVLLLLYILILVAKILRNKTRHSALVSFLVLLNILYLTYQLFWGMLYFQQPVSEKLPEGKTSPAAIKQLAFKYLDRCTETRKLVQEDRNGVFKVYDIHKIQTEILANQTKIPRFINQKKTTNVNSIKPSLYTGIMSYTGIMGYYNPFTAEALYNPKLPSTYLPFTLAHESAHQLGYAREQEANFIGFLLGKNAENPDLRYSTEYFALKSLLNALVESEPEFVKGVIRKYPVQMKRDRLAEKMFVKRHSGMLEVFFGFTNDLFLKSNQQDGTITYSYFVDLLVRHEKME